MKFAAPCGSSPENPLRVDDEEPPERDACLLDEDPVVSGDVLVEVGDEGVAQPAQPALLAGLVDPGQVGEVRVGRDAHNLGMLKYF